MMHQVAMESNQYEIYEWYPTEHVWSSPPGEPHLFSANYSLLIWETGTEIEEDKAFERWYATHRSGTGLPSPLPCLKKILGAFQPDIYFINEKLDELES
jgi:hypothetical protein